MGRLEIGTLKRKKMTNEVRTLEETHPLVTLERDTGNGYYLSARKYPSGDAEITALKLGSDDRFRHGGGAKRKNTDKEQMSEIVLQKSLTRARQTVRRKALTLNADRMLTLTFRDNVKSIDESWAVFKYFTKLMRERYSDRFQYIAVPERQLRGAVHFHLAISGFYPVKVVRYFWRRAAGKRGGNIDITNPRKYGKNSWNPRRIAQYLAKYLTKTDSAEFNRRRYSSGGQIQIPEPMRGWLALGVVVSYELGTILRQLSDLPIATNWESDSGYFHVTYLST